jgi:antitoxin component of RelBE/YafQ-DinJ toxin-antitoxin module
METVQLRLDERTLQRARDIARQRGYSLDELLVQLLQQLEAPDPLLGLFADEPELLDQITEAAMTSRERDALR